ncbi:MAG: hypothetical protein HKL99_02505 [Burkholderiales bacterium]|nr:hypothetical protein [Burkholderiales bacterium]
MTQANTLYIFKASWGQAGEFCRVFGNTRIGYDHNYAYFYGDVDEPIYRSVLDKAGFEALEQLSADDLVAASHIVQEHARGCIILANSSSTYYERFCEMKNEQEADSGDVEKEGNSAELDEIRLEEWRDFLNYYFLE